MPWGYTPTTQLLGNTKLILRPAFMLDSVLWHKYSLVCEILLPCNKADENLTSISSPAEPFADPGSESNFSMAVDVVAVCKPTYKRENKCCPVSQRFPRIRLRLFVIISIHHIKHTLTKKWSGQQGFKTVSVLLPWHPEPNTSHTYAQWLQPQAH